MRRALLLSLLACACAPIAGPVTVEALVHDPESKDGTRLGDVELSTITDLAKVEGELFSVRGGLRMENSTVLASIEDGDGWDEMVERCRGNGGNEFHPRMHHDGERWIAEDLETLTAFTIFASLEKAYERAKKSGDDEGRSKGAVIGITSEVVANAFFPIPLMTSDNAAYAPPLDGWLTLRVGLQQGVPFAMSLPVLAHEFGHRLFFHNVFKERALDVWRSRIDSNASAEVDRANRLLAGVDEGLADVFSLAVTGDLDGIPRAFRQAGGPFEAEADRRDLEGAFADAASYDGLNDLAIDAAFLEACGADGRDPLFEQKGFNFYCLGTVLARALWDASDRDVGALRDEVMPAVIGAMQSTGQALGDGQRFDVELLLEPIAAALPADLQTKACDAFSIKFASLIQANRVPTCPP